MTINWFLLEYQEQDVMVLWIPYDEEAAEYNIEVRYLYLSKLG